MFMHNFKYSLKVLVRSKVLLFWTFAFPIIMAIFFNLAFSNIGKQEQFTVFDIAIVNNEALQQNEFVKRTFEVMGDQTSEEQLFNVKYTTIEEAKELLENKEITGYFILEKETSKVVVKANGINETIFQNVVKEIEKNEKIVQDIVSSQIATQNLQGNSSIDYENLYNTAIQRLQQQNQEMIRDCSESKLDYMMIEYYTLIAMSCLYSAMLAMTVINSLLPNMSRKGMRVSIAPVKKVEMILSSLLSAFLVQLVGLGLLFVFTIFVIKVDYGSNIGLIALLAFVGSIAGISLGTCVGTMIKKSEGVKIGILIAVTMLGCFLSGMMGVTMKYVVDSNFAIINKINPASMITDGFYALYYYSTMDRYWFNIASLLVFSILLIAISIFSLRRQKYDSV